MRQILSALMKEGVVSIVLLVILCLLVWFGGMYLETPEKTRIAIICALLGMWAIMFIAQKVRAVQGAMRIEKQLKAQSGAQLAGADADKKAEIEALRGKFEESLAALKKSKGGKSALYTLPWYVIIGPPGSGKTTALQESGLNFPASQGNAKVKGIGGTRNCDWWFTDEGILLDTAGRYTTVAEDQKEWIAFLDMIKQSRKHKPINGAIVAIGIDELLRATQADLDRIAKDVRNRLDELSARLQAVFPVYVMFTKCDLLQGFMEFFEDFTKDERAQVWGMTFAFSVPDRQYADLFEDEARRLHEALAPRRTQLLASERPASKKQNIYLFPQQFALALPRMKEFVAGLFHATAFQESAILRGIYFSSGTQKGTPIDQLMARMGAALGVQSGGDADERMEKKSFFINQLFTRLMFPDKALARSTSNVLKKRRAVRAGLQFASVLALALAGYSFVTSFLHNRDLLNAAEQAAAGLAEVGDSPARELEQLQALEAMRRELAPLAQHKHPLAMGMGMYQGDKVFDAGIKPYMQRLRPLYLDPTARRIKTELQQRLSAVRGIRSSDDYQQLLDLWRVYRMLSGELEPQPALVASVLKKNQRWTGKVSGSHAGQIEELAGEQLEFLASILPRAYENPSKYPWRIENDGELVKSIGLELKNAYWEREAYESIIQRASEKLEPVTLASLLAGDDNRDLLEIRPAEGGDPQRFLCAFTQEAWDSQVKPLIDERAKDLAEMFRELGLDNKGVDTLVAGLRDLHKKRHEQEWRRFLGSIHPRQRDFRRMTDARDALRRLAGDLSPYRKLFRNAWEKRALNLGPSERMGEVTEQEQKALEESLKALEELRKATDDFVTATSEGSRVRGHLAEPKRLETFRDAINGATRKIREAFPKDAASGADVMNRVVEALFGSLRDEGVRELESVWTTTVSQPWTLEINGRYPFLEIKSDAQIDFAGERNDAKLNDVARMLNPKSGAIWTADALFRAVQNLKFNDKPMFVFKADYEDTIRDARVIRDALFDTAQDEKIKVRFGVTLVQRGLLRSSSFQLGLNPQGQPNILRWNDNRDQTKDFVWEQMEITRSKPGARITASWGEQTPRTDEIDLLDQGWGLLKVLHKGSISGPLTNTEGKKFFCTWRFVAPDGIPYTLEAFVTAAKAENPFAPGMFARLKIAPGVSQ